MARKKSCIVIGGGHNGLVASYYLARAGHKVTVYEARDIVGGAAVTEEFHPGFRNSVASYTVSLLNPAVIAEMNLHRHGLKIIEREMANFWPLGKTPGAYLKLPYGEKAARAEFGRLSERDADQLADYYATLDRAADVLRDLITRTPPNSGGGLASIMEMLRLGKRLSGLSLEDQQLLLDLFTKSAAEFLARWFTHPSIMAAFAFDGVVGYYGSPYMPGTAYVLLHHCFGEVNGKKGVWGHAVGGMGAVTAAMASAAREAGVDIQLGRPVEAVLSEAGRAHGIRLKNGEVVTADYIAANVNPKLLFTHLVEPQALPEDFLHHMEGWVCGSGTFRMNVALDSLPSFAALPSEDVAPHHKSGIIIAPNMEYLDRAWKDAEDHGWSRKPIVEMLIPSTMDDSLAPPGKHVASLFCQQFKPTPDKGTWDDYREDAADTILDTVEHYAPGFKDSVIARQILSPLDLERTFGLLGGDIFHGRLSLDQLFAARPAVGYADYRTPLKGLYLCGSGAHPGGGVTGLPGRSAAREMLKDSRRLFA